MGGETFDSVLSLWLSHTRSLRHNVYSAGTKSCRAKINNCRYFSWDAVKEGEQMVCRERERKKCRDQQVFPVETKKWICLFYNKLSARQCLCTQVIVVELIFFWHSKPREESKSWLFFFSFSFFWSVRAHACCSVCLSGCMLRREPRHW